MTNFELSANQLLSIYKSYSENSISQIRVTHKDVVSRIKHLKTSDKLSIKQLGKSIEGRTIDLIKIGTGKTKILAWTQMHGDEPTATAAIFDLINFFIADDSNNELRNNILSNIELYIIPILNPDGAEKHQRENVINIDINRDATRISSPESQILWSAAEEVKPEFAFNLHDQNSYYTAGRTNKTSAISLLAPPFDFKKSIDSTRKKGMQVILNIFRTLEELIPGHIARYSDDFEPRAFGDNFIKSGISSILIESGYYKGDEDKSFLRKLNFVSLVSALFSIADRSFEKYSSENYFKIPENESMLFDLLLRNLHLSHNEQFFTIDIGIKREKLFDDKSGSFYYSGTIDQIGDLSNYFGIEEIDLNGFEVRTPSIFSYDKSIELTPASILSNLFPNGYCYVKGFENSEKKYVSLPINFIKEGKNFEPKIKNDEPANLLICEKDKIAYLILNGYLHDLSSDKIEIHNGFIID